MVKNNIILGYVLLVLGTIPSWSMDDGDSGELQDLQKQATEYLDQNSSNQKQVDDSNKICPFDIRFNAKDGLLSSVGETQDVCDQIFILLDLKSLSYFSRTAPKYRKLLTSKHAHEVLIAPKVDNVMSSKGNFRFCCLEFNPGNITRKNPVSLSKKEIEQLCAASDLGDGDACLILAEMNWNNEFSTSQFVRHGLYRKALRLNKPGTIQEVWFPRESSAYNAACFGMALNAIRKTPGPNNNLSINKLKQASEALLCIVDGTYFKCGGVVVSVVNQLWNGRYERPMDESLNNNNSSNGPQKGRTLEEKERDFRLVAKLVKHGKKLGIPVMQITNNSGFVTMLEGIQHEGFPGIPIDQFEFALTNDQQLEMFIKQGGANVLMDKQR